MNNSLVEVHPELISEWSEKNLPLTPEDITFGSNKKVWWKGACGHEWQTSVKSRSNGENCPICSGARVMEGVNDLATLEPKLARQWSKKNMIKPTEVSIGSHKKVIWRCDKGHEWEAAVKSRTINKSGCPYCSHNKVLEGFNDLATLLPDIAAEWSDRNYLLLPTQVTVFANRKAWWKCKDCGKEWYTLISTRSGGSKCPYCSGYKLLKGFNDLATTHPEIASEWSEKNLPFKLHELYADGAVKKRAGIFEYILGGCKEPRLLEIRIFEESTKKAVYAQQTDEAKKCGKSNCPLCALETGNNSKRIWKFNEMDADHVTAWSKGGATDISNCQMLCKTHNRAKGNK